MLNCMRNACNVVNMHGDQVLLPAYHLQDPLNQMQAGINQSLINIKRSPES